MINKFIREGDKIELTPVGGKVRLADDGTEINKKYFTKISAITSDDTLELLMPMEKTKLILLPIDAEYNVVVYTEGGLYQCFARVIDRYKSEGMFFLAVELTSNLRKYQRREYYRFSCALEMCARNLEEEEINAVQNKSKIWLQPNRPIKRSVVVDISGGGLRFLSNQRYEPGSMIYCSYNLVRGSERKQYELVGKVLEVKELENRSGTFEHRVQYYNIDDATREEIIQFIFEEERKVRRKS
ncbi:MAG: flagellar brake domain-containing protein [Lachnospiraceae bacterium]|nr:flagellar brake domain-containing protein [Lachnospiraceae bacterium]